MNSFILGVSQVVPKLTTVVTTSLVMQHEGEAK